MNESEVVALVRGLMKNPEFNTIDTVKITDTITPYTARSSAKKSHFADRLIAFRDVIDLDTIRKVPDDVAIPRDWFVDRLVPVFMARFGYSPEGAATVVCGFLGQQGLGVLMKQNGKVLVKAKKLLEALAEPEIAYVRKKRLAKGGA